MSDPLQTNPDAGEADGGALERESKTERLLLAGLDHYFRGEYGQAINVWSRILFIDRNHARAHAYIERARAALAEQQRETEELLHTGADAFSRGDVDEARRLLSAAIEKGAAPDEALALLGRLDRLEATRSGSGAAVLRGRERRRRPDVGVRTPAPRRRARSLMLLLLASGVVGAVAAAAVWGDVAEWLPHLAPAEQITSSGSGPEDPLPVLRSSEIAVERARQLFAGGHLRDALHALESVRIADPARAEAERLRAEIQRAMLASRPRGPAAQAGGAVEGERPAQR